MSPGLTARRLRIGCRVIRKSFLFLRFSLSSKTVLLLLLFPDNDSKKVLMIDKKLLTLLLPSQLRFEPGSALSTVLEKTNTQLITNEVGKMNLQTIKTSVLKFIQDEDGLTIVEYAVAGGLITVAAVAAFFTLGTNVTANITCLGQAVAGAAGPNC